MTLGLATGPFRNGCLLKAPIISRGLAHSETTPAVRGRTPWGDDDIRQSSGAECSSWYRPGVASQTSRPISILASRRSTLGNVRSNLARSSLPVLNSATLAPSNVAHQPPAEPAGRMGGLGAAVVPRMPYNVFRTDSNRRSVSSLE